MATTLDALRRPLRDLRISVTDRCNFRCVYCMPEEGVAARGHDELLTAEEIAHFVRLVANEGISRVRLTGGEPLVSHRIVPLVAALRAIPGIEEAGIEGLEVQDGRAVATARARGRRIIAVVIFRGRWFPYIEVEGAAGDRPKQRRTAVVLRVWHLES